MKIYISIGKGIVVMIFIAMLFSCKNDLKSIQELNLPDTLPGEYIIDAEMVYSDSGHTKVLLISPKIISINDAEDPRVEFPDGLDITFYDDSLQPESRLTANFGVNFTDKKIMEARNDVVVRNLKKNEQMNTEHLIWDQRAKKIYSDVFVKITTDDKVLYGEGFESDEAFKNRTIKKVSGELQVNSEDDY